ncbi:MAG TPA: hypothetical protein VNL13_02810 [Sulfolobales archaeon]|nr:hypothetical protein [Sulfolobales archaeon]
MKRESRILLHLRTGGYDFIAVLRGARGIEHLRVLRIHDSIKDLVERISREGFFHEVRFVVTHPRDLSSMWLEVMRDLGRSDIKIDPKLPSDIEEILGSYVNALSKLAIALNKTHRQKEPPAPQGDHYKD